MVNLCDTLVSAHVRGHALVQLGLTKGIGLAAAWGWIGARLEVRRQTEPQERLGLDHR